VRPWCSKNTHGGDFQDWLSLTHSNFDRLASQADTTETRGAKWCSTPIVTINFGCLNVGASAAPAKAKTKKMTLHTIACAAVLKY
jgi:hypothetical protein